MNKEQISHIFITISQILEIKGDNPFKVRAYQNAARSLESISEDLELLVKSESLTKIKGVGPNLADHIKELVLTGKLKEYDQILKSIPSTLFEMLKVPGLGPKKVGIIWRKLGIEDIGLLAYACKQNRLLSLPGFGEKIQKKILKGIEYIKSFEGQHLFVDARSEAEKIYNLIKKNKDVIRIEIAGSIRRKKEVVKDIDIVVSAKKSEKIIKTFITMPCVSSVEAKGDTKSSVILKSGIAVDLRVVSDKEFPYALYHFTGSKEHNVAIRSLAKKKGLKINEYGLFKQSKLINCKDEKQILKKLDLDFIEPELRENQGEIEAALTGKLPKLVTRKDLNGLFHVHSTWSDGISSIEDMVLEAKKLGLKYIGIADHSRSAYYAGGLTEQEIKKQHKEIDKLNKKIKDITILKGIESDMLADGSLDYPDSILKTFDFVVISIHSNFNMTEEEMTKRIIKAIKNKYSSILGHPTGRLLLGRQGYKVNIHKIIDAAADYGVCIEINSHPQRLDLDWRYCKYAKAKGVKIAINPDAHSIEGLSDIDFGVGIARKGWLEKEDIINCLELKDVIKEFCNFSIS